MIVNSILKIVKWIRGNIGIWKLVPHVDNPVGKEPLIFSYLKSTLVNWFYGSVNLVGLVQGAFNVFLVPSLMKLLSKQLIHIPTCFVTVYDFLLINLTHLLNKYGFFNLFGNPNIVFLFVVFVILSFFFCNWR